MTFGLNQYLGAETTLKLIRENRYNLQRTSACIIPELVEVISYLEDRVKKLEREHDPRGE